MKKIVLVCGLIAGLLSAAWSVFSDVIFPNSLSLDTRMWMGYATMILALSLIFVGVKQYRDNYNNGIISFGKAFKISFYITLVASTIYVAVWLVMYYFFLPHFAQDFMSIAKAQMVADGKSAAVISEEMTKMAGEFELYKNPLFNIGITYMEILPVGLVMSLIASVILKRKEPLQEVVTA